LVLWKVVNVTRPRKEASALLSYGCALPEQIALPKTAEMRGGRRGFLVLDRWD
jgi:hypothetical protein